MAILGPDGKPIQSGPPVSDEVRQMVEQARAAAAQGEPQGGLQQLAFAFQSDVSSDLVLDTSCELLAEISKGAGIPLEQNEEYQLFNSLRNNRDSPEAYYTVGSRFFQLGQYFLARPFLARAQELMGAAKSQLSQAIDVELGQVMMELGAYQEAVNIFHQFGEDYEGLPIPLILKMTECYALLRDPAAAQELMRIIPEEAIEQDAGLEDWCEELGDLSARVEDFDEDRELALREWHYIQTRGILLETNPDEENVPGERFIFFQPSEEDVAYIVSLTAAMLDERGYAPTRLLWLGATSEPLARLFAEWWEVDEENIRPYQPGDNTDDEDNLALLVMAHSYDFAGLISEGEVQMAGNDQALQQLQGQRLAEIAQAQAGMIVFMLDVRWTERQPITPDIAGFLAQVCNLPWETRLQVDEANQTAQQIEETRDAVTIAKEIAAQFPAAEESDKFAAETWEEFAGCTDLIIDHRDGSLLRKSMVTHSPVKSPRFGF